jgi:hypothetical protein
MHPPLQAGPFEIVGLLSVASTVVLLLLFVAFGGFVYRSLRGDGIRWPEEEHEGDDVRRGTDEDEWKYY